VDEKPQIQALERTSPSLPMQPETPAAGTHDYVRHGTSTLFAVFQIATGHAADAGKPRHRRQEFLAFLQQVARASPQGQLHRGMDNDATHQTPEVRAWLAQNPRFQLHNTATWVSWLNLVGGVVLPHRTPGPAPDRRRLGCRAHQAHPRCRHRLERPVSPVRVGQDQHRKPEQSQPPDYLKDGP
jgi:hypothetical protein